MKRPPWTDVSLENVVIPCAFAGSENKKTGTSLCVPAGKDPENKKTVPVPCAPAGRDSRLVIDKKKKLIQEKELSIVMLNKQVQEAGPSRYDVCELFSPPRICAAAREQGLRGGWSLDIIVSDPGTRRSIDLRNSKDQKEVEKIIKRYCPHSASGVPPCTAVSIAKQVEIDPQVVAGAVEMIRFSFEVCELQHKAGRQFIFEEPQSSRAWNLDEVIKMTYREGVIKTTCSPMFVWPGSRRPDRIGSGIQTHVNPHEPLRAVGSSTGEMRWGTPSCPVCRQAGVHPSRNLPGQVVQCSCERYARRQE